MALTQGPMNILRSVHHVMNTEFDHLNLVDLHEFVDAGAETALNPHTAKNIDVIDLKVYDDLPDEANRADRKAMGMFDRHVRPHMRAFSTMMEVVSPQLVKYAKLVDTLRDYIQRQKRQSRVLLSMVVFVYVFALILVTFLVFYNLAARPTIEDKVLAVMKMCIAGVVIQWLLLAWKMLLESRVQAMGAVDISVLDKYYYNLGKNVYVLYADAYTRGVHKQFAEEYYNEQYFIAEENMGDPAFDACRKSSGKGDEEGAFAECTINPCTPKSLLDELSQSVFVAWATRKDPKKCSRLMLALLEALKELSTGEVFESRDQHDMWHAIRNGVEKLRKLVYRRYDIDEDLSRTNRDSALDVIKTEVLPVFDLGVVETRDLRPVSDSLTRPIDAGIIDRMDCWAACMEDDDCKWATFNAGECFRSTADMNTGAKLEFGGTSSPTTSSVVTLLKRDASKPTYVCGRGIKSSARVKLTDVPKENDVSARQACDAIDRCNVIEGDHKAWSLSETDYRKVLGDSSDRTDAGTDYCVKSSGDALYRANLERGAFATFYAFLPKIVEGVVDVLKKHYGRVRLSVYHDYIHAELEKKYRTSGQYDLIRPLVEDSFRRIDVAMKKLRLYGEEATMYITPTRFEDKIGKMTYTEVWALTDRAGSLARTTKLYQKNFPSISAGSGLGDRILKLTGSSFIFAFILGIAYYNTSNGFCFKAGICNGGTLGRGIVLTISLLAFVLVIMASVIMRYAAKSSYNGDISERNGRILVSSAVRLMELKAHLLEHRAKTTFLSRSTSYIDIRDDFAAMYERFGYAAGVQRIQNGEGDLAETPPDMQYLYTNVRDVIEAYDKCNTLTSPRKMPFPIYEIIIYTIVMLLIAVILLYAYHQLDPLARIRNINRLNELRSDIQMGMPPPPEFTKLMDCLKTSDSAWSMLVNTAVALLALFNVYIVYTVVKSSKTYRMGLYSSSLFTQNKCVA